MAPAAVENTVSQTACDVAGFISDVTIPDGTKFAGGDSFTKTWKFRNNGACTWDSDYLLVFKSGDSMDGPDTQQLMDDDDTVAPGKTIKVSVDLVAPDDEGTYTGSNRDRATNQYDGSNRHTATDRYVCAIRGITFDHHYGGYNQRVQQLVAAIFPTCGAGFCAEGESRASLAETEPGFAERVGC